MGISPSVSVQATLDGGICEAEVMEEGEKAPCTKQCWEATEERCVCRCGGLNHGRAWRNNTSLDVFGSEGAPIIASDIARGRLELMLVAKREVAAAHSAFLGGLRG
jgi:hypothetical protein